MIDERDLEQAERVFAPPEGSFDRFLRRRDRKRRNKRIAAGLVGIGIFVAAVWIVTTAGSFDRTQTPADKPTVNPADTAKEVALGFLDAIAAFDAQKAISYVADDADFRGIIRISSTSPGPFAPIAPPNAQGTDTEGLSLMLSMGEAAGSKLILTSCETAAFASDTSVVCDFDFHLIRSDQIGRGPFSGSYFVFTVRDGAIVRASVSENSEKFERQMWEPFAEWVSSKYPKDAALMYLGGTLAHQRLSPESIRLWERHTRDYVRAVQQGTAQ